MDRREFFEMMVSIPVLGLIFGRKRGLVAGPDDHSVEYERAIADLLDGKRVMYLVARHPDVRRAQDGMQDLLRRRGVEMMSPYGAIFAWRMSNQTDPPVITIRAAVGDECHMPTPQNHQRIILDSSIASLTWEETNAASDRNTR